MSHIQNTEMEEQQIKSDSNIDENVKWNNEKTSILWSFVKVNKNGQVIEVREKEKISDNCTLGAYYFKTCALYENLYNGYYFKN